MKLSLVELNRICKWFDITTQYEDLKDEDIIIHDKIMEYLEEKEITEESDDLTTYLDEDLNEDNDDEEDKNYDKFDFYEEEDEDNQENY